MATLRDALLNCIVERTESPIEKLFAEAYIGVIFEMWGEYDGQFSTARSCRFLSEIDRWNLLPKETEKTSLHVDRLDVVGSQIGVLSYRVDFFIGVIQTQTKVITKLPGIVVECDGHDFHERTKEQARRDKSRDRKLLAAGYRVMRFTGSELYRDADGCAREVDAIIRSSDGTFG